MIFFFYFCFHKNFKLLNKSSLYCNLIFSFIIVLNKIICVILFYWIKKKVLKNAGWIWALNSFKLARIRFSLHSVFLIRNSFSIFQFFPFLNYLFLFIRFMRQNLRFPVAIPLKISKQITITSHCRKFFFFS